MVDKIDLKIINILKENSRISFADLGREISLSPSSIRERVKNLEDNEVIKKYSIDINNKKLGYDLEAFILLKVFPGKLKNMLSIISSFEEVKEVHRITGNQNIHLKIVVKDQQHLQSLLDNLMEYGDTTTFLILSKL
ncbi:MULTISPECIES: Lrp/AsnC family transcriptional regulator [Tenacibaculum]|uniref:Lrp/AsnC family transcriptional regulator n=1 Tax=Tenacibaculum TaxID=104267 RepID=UPI000894EB93|nr:MULTISPECIES: Lrp/AsnC family transcriptional regulator [unclassified Tenacibaculum]RBW56320.1 Lrp/AsnC family transcriptional regulator [Tenacibaculum sp. E3R01]SEE45766.1 transcriptional regulator, AsnC family [Tenacibaculum sp. MAR_2010_89]